MFAIVWMAAHNSTRQRSYLDHRKSPVGQGNERIIEAEKKSLPLNLTGMVGSVSVLSKNESKVD